MFLSESMLEHLIPLMTEIMQTPPLKKLILERLVADPSKVEAEIDHIAKNTDHDGRAIESILLHLVLAEKKKQIPSNTTLIHECAQCGFFNKVALNSSQLNKTLNNEEK